MPLQENKTSVEIGRIKNKLIEVESQLREEKKITAKLRDTSEKKIYEASIIDIEIAAEMESFRWKKAEIVNTNTAFEEESALKISELIRKENMINEEIAGFDVIEFENKKYHSQLKELSSEQSLSINQQNSERDKKKQKDFDVRMGLEEIFRFFYF
jgi:hypothetical protein